MKNLKTSSCAFFLVRNISKNLISHSPRRDPCKMSDIDKLQTDAPSVPKNNNHLPETTFTLRHPPYTYVHLHIKTLPATLPTDLDLTTAHAYLRSALSSFLGLTGAAIPLSLLKVSGRDIWLRVPTGDASAVVAAVSQWTSVRGDHSLKVVARGTWLGAVMARGGGVGLWTMGGDGK